jgi:hypothetical protein
VEGLLGEEVEQWSSSASQPAATGGASTPSNPDP